jgi:hypothetical protein
MKTAADLRKVLQGEELSNFNTMQFFADMAVIINAASESGTAEQEINALFGRLTRQELAVALVYLERSRAVLEAFEDLATFSYAKSLIESSLPLAESLKRNAPDLTSAVKQSSTLVS